jgi:hypothetical protein
MRGTERAMVDARRYIALRFPRSSGPWPGLGIENTLAFVERRIDTLAPEEILGDPIRVASLATLRRGCSAALRRRVDREAAWPPLRRASPDWPLPDDGTRDLQATFEGLGRAEVVDAMRAWTSALRCSLADGGARLDVATDRFVLAREARRLPRLHRRREPAPPSQATSRPLLRDLYAWLGERARVLRMGVRVHLDPLDWLDDVLRAKREQAFMRELQA